MKTPWDRCSGEGWTADPRQVPAELEDDYTAHEFTEAEQAAAAVILELGEGQQAELWNAVRDHLDGDTDKTCEVCGAIYTSVKAAILCADADNEDDRRTRRLYRGSD